MARRTLGDRGRELKPQAQVVSEAMCLQQWKGNLSCIPRTILVCNTCGCCTNLRGWESGKWFLGEWAVTAGSRGRGGVLPGASLLFLMHRGVCLVTTEHCTFLTQVPASRSAH